MTYGQIGLIILLAMGDVLMQGHPFSFDSSHKARGTVAAVIRGEHRASDFLHYPLYVPLFLPEGTLHWATSPPEATNTPATAFLLIWASREDRIREQEHAAA